VSIILSTVTFSWCPDRYVKRGVPPHFTALAPNGSGCPDRQNKWRLDQMAARSQYVKCARDVSPPRPRNIESKGETFLFTPGHPQLPGYTMSICCYIFGYFYTITVS